MKEVKMALLDKNGLPIIEPHKDQKLIIEFVKNGKGNDVVTISFDPIIPEVRTPAQAAAVNVANHIIRSFGLDNGEQNAESSETRN